MAWMSRVDMFGTPRRYPNIVAIKESSEDTRRLTDLRRVHGDRFRLFAGVDDVVLESLMLGAQGWVSGLTNAFPRESVALFALARAGRYEEALAIYRWFMPLLHLDTIPTLVQCIKLTEQLWDVARKWFVRRACASRAPSVPKWKEWCGKLATRPKLACESLSGAKAAGQVSPAGWTSCDRADRRARRRYGHQQFNALAWSPGVRRLDELDVLLVRALAVFFRERQLDAHVRSRLS